MSEIRRQICDLNIALQSHGLVQWTAGNVSERLPEGNRFIIKPSGVLYEELQPEQMVICDLNGNVLEGDLAPSSDTKAHAYVYQHMPDIGGVVHTHSNYASAWAAAQMSIPCVLTAMADEFGGDIPLGPFALIGNDDIGRGIVSTLSESRSPAVIMRNHGVFAVGKNAKAALKSAVMCEDAAKTVWIAKSLGPLQRMSTDDIDHLYQRYQNVYGQSGGNKP
jgi:L-ribulose-5-phosphate 4-epimerase